VKLIIQIPCFNEEHTLPATINALPKKIPGIDEIEYLVINDGSTDRTVAVARSLGVHHIIGFPNNRGLAKCFIAGIDACLRLGADIIVNTDGDNQYNGADIARLVQPLLSGKAEIAVGDRQVDSIEHFSFVKKKLQKIGSWIVRLASGSNVVDTTSGFRAFTREAAMRLNVVSDYSYTLETLIDAGCRKMAIANVPVRINKPLRKSRLIPSTSAYIKNSASTIMRIYSMRQPLKVFLTLSGLFSLAGIILIIRYLYYYFSGSGSGHMQSLILAAILIIVAVQLAAFGLLSDAISASRKVNDEILYRLKRIEYDKMDRIIAGNDFFLEASATKSVPFTARPKD